MKVTLYLNSVCAGFPSPASDYLEGEIDLFIGPDGEYLVYNQEFQINEDYELNIRINNATDSGVVVNTELVVDYFVRNSLFGLIKQFFRYGLWKTKTLSVHPDSLKKRHIQGG